MLVMKFIKVCHKFPSPKVNTQQTNHPFNTLISNWCTQS